jgi:hypothetical protein
MTIFLNRISSGSTSNSLYFEYVDRMRLSFLNISELYYFIVPLKD